MSRTPDRTWTATRDREMERGQSLVEVALILPLLLVLLIGIVTFANAWRTSQTITNIAREGARLGVTPGATTAEVEARVNDLLDESGLSSEKGDVTVEDVESSPGDTVRVTIRYPVSLGPFDRVVDLLCSGCGDEFGAPITLNTLTSMRKE